MTSPDRSPRPGSWPEPADSPHEVARNLWLHFTRMSSYAQDDVPVIVRGSGPYVYDDRGKRYLDGLSGLFVNQIGHGRREVAEAGARQGGELAYFPLWSYAHPRAIELAQRLADLAPGPLNRVFFTTSGSEAVESAWKLAKQYFRIMGQPGRHKVISRDIAYHGTSLGALAITGLADIKYPFEPMPPGGVRVPNTNFYRAPEFVADDLTEFGRWAAGEIERAILREGPESVAAVFIEPVQNAGGCFPPPPGYFQQVRQICDRYGVLLVSDEVICAFGRLGHYFGSQRYGYQPDIITFAKGVTSGYAPMGGMIASDALMEPFAEGTATFLHGVTFGGHPVSAAVALANLELFEKERVPENVRANGEALRAALDTLLDLPIVGDVRGDGYFYGIELVKDKASKTTFDDDESERLLRGFLSTALFDAGLVCRTDDRGDPVVQLAPPLICTQEHFDEIEQILRSVLTEAWTSDPRQGAGPKAMPSGPASAGVVPGAPATVEVTVPVAVEITEMVPDMSLPTHTWVPSGVTATDAGSRPTPARRTTRPVEALMTVTVSEFMSATYTAPPCWPAPPCGPAPGPGPAASAHGCDPAGIRAVTAPVRVAISHTSSAPGLATYSRCPSGLTAMPCGPAGSGTVPATRPAAVSISCTARAVVT